MHKRVSKRKGFTLLEMVVVIAIIVMLATVTISSVVNYIKWSNEQKAKVANHDTAIDRAQQEPHPEVEVGVGISNKEPRHYYLFLQETMSKWQNLIHYQTVASFHPTI